MSDEKCKPEVSGLGSARSDAQQEEPEVYSIRREGGGYALSRRDLLRAGSMSVIAAAAASAGVQEAEAKKSKEPKIGKGAVLTHEKPVRALAINSSATVLYSAADDGFVKSWSLPGGGLFKAINVDASGVTAITVGPDGHFIATGTTGGTIQTRNLPDAGVEKTLRDVSPISFLRIGTSGKILYALAGTKMHVWSLNDGKLTNTVSNEEEDVLCTAISPDAKTLYTGSANGTVNVWSLPDERLEGKSSAVKKTSFSGHSGPVRMLAVSQDGTMLCSAGEDHKILVRALPEGSVTKTLKGGGETIHALVISSDMKRIFAGGSDKVIRVWSLPQGKPDKALKGHSDTVTSLVCSNDGALLASGSADKTVRLWNLGTGLNKVLIDLAVNHGDVRGSQFEGKDEFGRNVTFTQPCGTPIPAGAVCVCNCVPGTIGHSGRTFSTSGICTCDLVCTCNTVCTCLSVCSCVGNATTYTYSYHYWHPN